MANPRDVHIDIIGRDRTRTATESAGRNLDRLNRHAHRTREAWAKAGAAVAGVTIAAQTAARIMSEGLAIGLQRANAQVALGTMGYAQLSSAATESAHALGLTTSEYIAGAGKMAILAKNLGFGAQAAISFGRSLPELAQRISVMSGGTRSAAESANMLRSALAGEYDPLQTVGIAISAATVEQRALEIQGRSTTAMTLDQAKSLAVLEITYQQTGQAVDVLSTAEGKAAVEAAQHTAALKEQWQALEQDLAPAIATMLAVLNTAVETTTQAGDSTASWTDRIHGATTAINWLVNPLAGAASSASDYAMAGDDASTSTSQLDDAMAALGLQSKDAAGSVDAYAQSVTAARTKTDEMTATLLGIRDAERDYAAAIDRATEAAADNGKTLDITTEAGRANQAALDGIAAAGLRAAQQTRDNTGSEASYRAALASTRSALVTTARQMGMSRSAAEQYAAAILGIPSAAGTRVTMPGIDTAMANARYYRDLLGSIPRRITVTTRYKSIGRPDARLQVPRNAWAAGDAGWSGVQPGQLRRTDPPTPVTVESHIYLDGAPLAALVRSSADRTAYRAHVGRR